MLLDCLCNKSSRLTEVNTVGHRVSVANFDCELDWSKDSLNSKVFGLDFGAISRSYFDLGSQELTNFRKLYFG